MIVKERAPLNPEAQGEVLQDFSKALQREVHNLTQHPDLLWQQMHNHLQWEKGPTATLLANDRKLRSMPGMAPWVCTKTRFYESAALLFTVHIPKTEEINDVGFSPDGTKIISAIANVVFGGDNNLITLWDANTLTELRSLRGHTRAVHTACFSPDGTRILSASKDETIKLWDAHTGAELHSSNVRGLRTTAIFSPDGEKVVWTSRISFYLYDACPGEELKERCQFRTRYYGEAEAVVFSPDGARIVSANRDGTLMIWDASTGEVLDTLEGHSGQVKACAFSPDGGRIVSASKDNTLKIWDASSGHELHTLDGHKHFVQACAFSPDGTSIVSGSSDHMIKLWDARTGEELGNMEGHTDGVIAVAFSPDGTRIVSASKDNTLKLWDAYTDLEMRTKRKFYGYGGIAAFSPYGERIVSAGDTIIRMWDSNTGKELWNLEDPRRRIQDTAFSPDGKYIVSASGENTLKLLDKETGWEMYNLQGHIDVITATVFSPDSTRILSASQDETLRLWDVLTGKELCIFEFKTSWGNKVAAFSPDGARIVSAGFTLNMWDSNTGEMLCYLDKNWGHYESAAFSPDGTLILSTTDFRLVLWDIGTGEKLFSLAFPNSIRSAVFSPDGSRIVSSAGKTIMIFDTSTGEELFILDGHTKNVTSVEFSPDGACVVSTGVDGTLRVWSATTGLQFFYFPQQDQLTCAALHPWQPIAACAGWGDVFYLIDLVGIEYGPIIVTPADRGQGLTVRCPACQKEHPIQDKQLGHEMTCPTPGCGLRLKINPFTIEMK